MEQTLPVLAAWLHDIGKFAQRANAPYSKGMEQEYCPSGKTHQHVLYTDYFIKHELPLPPELEGDRSRLARLASAHHKPDDSSREETALQSADFLSSGGDRLEGNPQGDYKTARLESVFTNVRLNNKGMPKDAPPLRYRLRPLGASDDVDSPPIFPVQDAAQDGSYQVLYDAFLKALKDEKNLPLLLGVRHYMTSLASLLEQYTWCIPSSTYRTRADISLYDHAATTAAIVQALLACPEKEQRLLLFGGDISGIQRFIFGAEGQADKGVSKLLRARSLYLQALTRSVWLTLLDNLGLSSAAKIMDAGGRYVLLLPDTPKTKDILTNLQTEMEDWLLKIFQGTVRMSFATLSLKPYDLERVRFRECFERFNDALEQAKLRPFAKAFQNGVSPVMAVDHTAYAQWGECDCCRSRPAEGLLDDTTAACNLCRKLIEQVGRRLPTAHYLVFTHTTGGVELFGGLHLRLEEKADAHLLRDALDVVNMRGYDGFSAVPVAGHIPFVTEADLNRWKSEGRIVSHDGQNFMGGDEVQLDTPKTFAMLAEEARLPAPDGKGRRSIACLAACKADVDNLGLLFGMGFGSGKESLFSISRFAMLSRMMNHFFAGHVPRLMEHEFPNMYLIFAGGDDLFALGPWSEAVRFALRLQEDFTQFTANNPAVTFSAGLPVFKPRLPMRALRRAAEDALETSKKHSGKNAATLFGITAAWPRFRSMQKVGQWLEDLCLHGDVTQGFVRRLLGYARECRDFNQGDMRKGLYLSHMAYDMKRNCKETPEMERLRHMGMDKQNFPLAELSVTWALYRTRTTG